MLRIKQLVIVCGLTLLIGFGACLPNDTADLPTVLEILEGNSRYSEYMALSGAAGRTVDLDGGFIYTLFVPSNEALDSFKVRQGISDYSELDDTTINQLVWYHRQLGKIGTSDMNSGYFTTPAASIHGGAITMLFNLNGDGGNIVLNESAKIVSRNNEGSDGLIHTIDEVLLPPSAYDVLAKNENFSIFLEAAEKGGLAPLLQEQGTGITVFAAPDEVWQNFFDEEPGVENLDDYSENELEDMIQYHILRTLRDAEELNMLSFPQEFPTQLAGEPLEIVLGPTNSIVIDDTIGVFLLNVHATNGVLHFIDDVLEIE
ncbi:MAG: fasciclin domain-containing protein [Bacteroidota bacterium]